MADRRMFTKRITDGDVFTALPPTTQCLYFHLCMGADDDGFSNNVRIALFNAHASIDDFNMLVNKRLIIPFDSGVIVIKHWRMHNYIQNDRYHETKFIEEKSQLTLKANGVYTECIQNVYSLDTEIRLGKDSIEKVSIYSDDPPEEKPKKEVKHKYGTYKRVLLTDKELESLKADFGEEKTETAIAYLDAYIVEKEYKSKSHYMAMRRWVFDAIQKKAGKQTTSKPSFNQIIKSDYNMDEIEAMLLKEGGEN